MRTLGKIRDAMDETTRVELLLEQVGLSPEIRKKNSLMNFPVDSANGFVLRAREFDWDGKGEEILEDRMFS
jgi:hypothetical protein